MDIQAQVAARRAELVNEQRKAEEEAARLKEVREAVERGAREKALDEIAAEISTKGVEVRRELGELQIVEPISPLDVKGLKQSKITGLLNREARKLWSPADNWFVISCIVAGVCTVPLRGFGVVLLAVGLLGRHSLNKKYRAMVRDRYPDIFSAQ
jgi:hypothetical protein